ncbi:hypothetical protein ABZW18_31580 [Streptomyces sp. NPDC004647]|uniref:hypothetical protein n=1 Tax=Streptomyces sp. NPDC004647 TaxID=3154671 RepID=UPI0033BF6ABA
MTLPAAPGRSPPTRRNDQPDSRKGADGLLRRWLPTGPHGGPQLVRADRGYWDDRTCTVSLINLDTVDARATRSRRAGRSVALPRQRYVTGAWSREYFIAQSAAKSARTDTATDH